MKCGLLFLIGLCATLSGNENFNVEADWLYWKAHESNLSGEYYTSPFVNTNKSSYNAKGRNVILKDEWSSGFRVASGYTMPCSAWKVGLVYSYLPSVSRFCGPKEGEYLFRTNAFNIFRVLGVFNALHVDAKWDLHFSYGDLDISRAICLKPGVSVRPHAGFRGLWINQHYNLHWVRAPTAEVNSNPAVSTLMMKEKLQGYGVEGGCWMDWQIVSGLSLVGHFGGAVVYSKADIENKSKKLETPFGAPPSSEYEQNICLTDRVKQINPMIDTFLGVQYHYAFCATTVYVRAGFEQHFIFDTNNWVIGLGNLGLQGLTLGSGISF